jgi:hypothetical protein
VSGLHFVRVEIYVNTPLLTGWLVADKGPGKLMTGIAVFRMWQRRISQRRTVGALMKGSGVRLRLSEPYIKASEPVVLAEWHTGDKGHVYDGGPTPGDSKKCTPGKRATAAAAPGSVVAAATTLDTQKRSARQQASQAGPVHSPKT